MIESRAIQIGIYRRDPDAHWKVDDVDVGPLVGPLTKEPRYFGEVPLEGGAIKVTLQRTHEFEIILDLLLVGSGLFLKGAIEELGKQFVSWLVGRTTTLGTKQKPEVRGQGLVTVVVNPSAMNEASAAITSLVTEAAQAGTRVLLIVEPGSE
jgi:hypothetical protein